MKAATRETGPRRLQDVSAPDFMRGRPLAVRLRGIVALHIGQVAHRQKGE